MRKVAIFSGLLVIGLVLSQLLPGWFPAVMGLDAPGSTLIAALTMFCLSFIMIEVGLEFDIDKRNLRPYAWDYFVAATAAGFPWIFVAAYFIFVLLPASSWGNLEAWKESLLAGRFAAPTSAGVLFSMLAAAGLGATWLFKKARILAIFDDLDTVLLMIPLKMLMVGVRWQLGAVILLVLVQLWLGWVCYRRVRLPHSAGAVLLYAALITIICKAITVGSEHLDPAVPIHMEVLLPAFVWGCVLRHGKHEHVIPDAQPDEPSGKRIGTVISAAFMLLVGLSMPAVIGSARPADASTLTAAGGVAPTSVAASGGDAPPTVTESSPQPAGEPDYSGPHGHTYLTDHVPPMGWGMIIAHTLAVTVLANLGKMFPALCYRREAHWRERLALAIGMWPRGEVGAGVLVVSVGYGIGGPAVTIAMLSLALNLVLTGGFVILVKRLIAPVVRLA